MILGDFIDRGPSSATIIELLMRLSAEPNITVLRGNHEETMVDAVGGDHAAMDLWLAHGGLATLESFDADVAMADIDDSRMFMDLRDARYRDQSSSGFAVCRPMYKSATIILSMQA